MKKQLIFILVLALMPFQAIASDNEFANGESFLSVRTKLNNVARKVDGQDIMTNFESTGIDDNAVATSLSIDSSGDVTLNGDLDVIGTASIDTILVTNFESTGIDDNSTSNAITITSNEKVGIGETNPFSKLHIVSTGSPLYSQFSGSFSNNTIGCIDLIHKTSNSMFDGFGSRINFRVTDSGVTDIIMGSIAGVRDGSDTEGALVFKAGTDGNDEFMRISSDGGVSLSTIKSGATQVGSGAAANEIWKTSGHATLPDNVLLIGI